ncbi:hypothetical protein TB1_026800 [Malus domestica]
MKARFQYIREARVLGFEVDQYTDIDTAELPFSFEELQYLRHHFEVFSVVSLLSLMADEKDHMERLDAYLDTRDAQIAYEERARKALHGQNQTPVMNKLKDDNQNETGSFDIPQE